MTQLPMYPVQFVPVQDGNDPRVVKLLHDWHEEGRPHFERHYPNLNHDTHNPKRAVSRTKYVLLDEGTSGAFILEKASGYVYRIKSAYGVPNRKKCVGNIDTLSGADLSKWRWY